ncbi:MAG: beta-propeller fold lactonase family protein [Candidatus Rokubacteria bacterium]|nr:beta-propeller fold lactonase family protein [Candidatus Rokubacteria bacterium]
MRRSLTSLIALGGALAVGLLAASAEAATLYVTNTKSDSISIIDTNTFEVTGTIPLGPGKPNRVVFHPDGKTAWVVYDKSRDLGIVDAETQRLAKRVRIGGNPYNLAFTPDGRYLYVLDWSSESSKDEIIIYDLKAERVDGRIEVSTWPAHGVFSRDGKIFYVTSETAGNVAAIDTGSRKIVATVWTGGDAMGVTLAPDEKILYTAAGEAKSVVKVDTATRQAVGSIPMPGITHETTLTLDGQFLYVTLRKANKILVVGTADDTIVATIPQPSYPDLVVMEPSGRYAFVTNRHADVVTVIDVKTHRQVKAISVGKAPHGMSLRPR